MAKVKKITVFYSWQMDSPKETNLKAIRKAIEKAGRNIGAIYSDIEIIPDEATRDTPGSPNIVTTIIDKISKADIFVADITTITARRARKASPNPNVMFELGFATAQLGWERIILMFNEGIGNFSKDIPFDIDKNRISKYHLKVTDEASEHLQLYGLVQNAIKLIIDKNPKRPVELAGKSRTQLQHESDVENLRGLMSTLHLPAIDKFISELPHTLNDDGFFYWDYFKLIASGSAFHIYDPTILSEIDAFAIAWSNILEHPNYYEKLPNDNYIFARRSNTFSGHIKATWDQIEDARDRMRSSLDLILSNIRENFIEVDLTKTSQAAWNFYKKIHSG